MTTAIHELREFGVEISNTMTDVDKESEHTEKRSSSDHLELEDGTIPMDVGSNGSVCSLISKALGFEIFSLVNNYEGDIDDLMDDVDNVLSNFYVGENVYHSGKEHVIKKTEKRGGLILCTMNDGSKIGHRELKRKKGLNLDYIRKEIEKNTEKDGDIWKVSESVKDLFDVKDVIKSPRKLAPIFLSKSNKGSDDDVECLDDIGDEDGRNMKIVFARRASGGMAPSSVKIRKIQEKAKREEERQKRQEVKEKEKEEKRKKKSEEKQKQKEMEKAAKEKKKEKNEVKKNEKEKKVQSGLDGFLKKKSEIKSPNSTNTGNSQFFEDGLKKLESAWTLRDPLKFNSACEWCEKKLTTSQISKIPNSLWKFSVQMVKERKDDIKKMKLMTKDELKVYKESTSMERKPMELEIKSHFEVDRDDFVFSRSNLILPIEAKVEASVDFFRCLELTQFIVSAKDYLNYKYNVSADALYKSLQGSKNEGMNSILLSVYETFYKSLIADEKYKNICSLFIRISEYTVNVNSISHLIKSLFEGRNKKYFERMYMKFKKESQYNENGDFAEVEDEELDEDENEDEIDEDEKEISEDELVEDEENDEGNVTSEKKDNDAEINARKMELLAYFDNGVVLNQMDIDKQLDIMEFLRTLITNLETFREYMIAPESVSKRSLTNEKNDLSKTISAQKAAVNELQKILDNSKNRGEVLSARPKLKAAKKNLSEATERLEIVEKQLFELKINDGRSLRTPMIGFDRHMRRYYWMAHNSDAGIWIQDLGTSNYEVWIKKCIENNLDPMTESEELPNYYEDSSEDLKETWYHINDAEMLNKLIKNLLSHGAREKHLKSYLTKNREYILNSNCDGEKLKFQNGSANDVDVCNLTGFKNALIDFVKQLDSLSFTRIPDVTDIITRIEGCEKIMDVKQMFIEVVRSIVLDTIIVSFNYYEKIKYNAFSYLNVSRFCMFISITEDVSALFQMMGRLQSRIKWNKSTSRICHICKRACRERLYCQDCSKRFHQNCLKGVEVTDPVYWSCPSCAIVSDSSNEEQEGEPVLSENGVTYLRKAKKRANNALTNQLAPKRTRRSNSGSFDGVEDDEGKQKPSALPKVIEAFEKVSKANPRLFKNLYYIDSKVNNRDPQLTLNEIENSLYTYDSAGSLHKDMSRFFRMARVHFETNNSRKIEELDELILKFGY